MNHAFRAAWVPYVPGRSGQAASGMAQRWAEQQAAARNRPVVSVVAGKTVNVGPIFRCRSGSRESLPMVHLPGGAGAVVVATPTFEVVQRAAQLSAGSAMVVIDDRGPNRLTGWAGALGATNLDNGQPATLDPTVREYITDLVLFDTNQYAEGWSRDSAHKLLAEMAAAGLLERAVVLGALVAYGVSARGLTVIASLIDLILPVATLFATPPD